MRALRGHGEVLAALTCAAPPLRRRASLAGAGPADLGFVTPRLPPAPTARLLQTTYQPVPGERKSAASGRTVLVCAARRWLRATQRMQTDLAGCSGWRSEESMWRACDAPHATAARSSTRVCILLTLPTSAQHPRRGQRAAQHADAPQGGRTGIPAERGGVRLRASARGRAGRGHL